MSSESIRQLSSSAIDVSNSRIRYVVKDNVRTQVVDSKSGKVIREIPRKLSPNILKNVYA